MTSAATEPGTASHPAFRLMLAVADQDPGAVKMLLAEAEAAGVPAYLLDTVGEGNGLRALAFHVAGIAVALWEAPCAHCAETARH